MTLVRGQPSIGLSNRLEKPATLPPLLGTSSVDVSAQLQLLLDRVEDLTTLVEGKADANKLKTLIQYSDEAIRIQADQIALVGTVTFLDVWRDQTGQSTGVLDPSLTIIRGGVIQTGVIKGNAYGPTDGIAIDLDNDVIIAGGFTAPKLIFENGDLTISGTLTAGSVIVKGTIISDLPGSPSLEDIYDMADAGITAGELDTLLAAGVGNVFAGLGNDYVLTVNSTYIAAKHKDTNIAGLGAGYSGDLRTGLIISANGIGMGYNDKITGDFIYSVAIDGTTGEGTFKGAITATSGTFVGTVSAGAVIADTVTINGVSLATIVAQAEAGADLKDALEVSGTTILKGVLQPQDTGALKIGTITWNATTGALTGGSGIAITEFGLIGASSGSPTFTINASTGAATFAGTLSAATGTFAGSLSAATGTFSGSLSAASGTFIGAVNATYVTATNGQTIPGGYGNATIAAIPGDFFDDGFFGYSGSSKAGHFVTSNGTAVYAVEDNAGGSGYAIRAYANEGTAIYCQHLAGGTALNVNGNMVKTGTTVVTNLNADMVDGIHASSFVLASANSFQNLVKSLTWTKVETSNDGSTVAGQIWVRVTDW